MIPVKNFLPFYSLIICGCLRNGNCPLIKIYVSFPFDLNKILHFVLTINNFLKKYIYFTPNFKRLMIY